ncbi:hypothetical protein PGT21_036781 [Puccinia graminis f. sp. tritici]|uniref:Uncharacterized protein n=1 Tax=Puccinia graminis f. sp. tritici TaxID=56615 RepID=A0A5B0PNG6_PUCGR|nr:hypothetical protein PGT21_036781 [Puccinia graminis f. sp. tritici]
MSSLDDLNKYLQPNALRLHNKAAQSHNHNQYNINITSKPYSHHPASHSSTPANPLEKNNSRLSSHPKSSTYNALEQSTQTHQTTTRTSEPKQYHHLSSAPSSLKPLHSTRKPKSFEPPVSLSPSFSPSDRPPIITNPTLSSQNDKSNQKRVLPISTDGSDPEQSETEPERSTSRNQKEARTQNDRSNPTIPSQLNNELSTTETGPTAANVQCKK